MDKAVEACNNLGKKLLVIGHGPEKEHLQQIAGDTIRIASGVTVRLRYAYAPLPGAAGNFTRTSASLR